MASRYDFVSNVTRDSEVGVLDDLVGSAKRAHQQDLGVCVKVYF